MTLDTVWAAFNEGATAEEIVQQYPSLSLADAYQAVGYCLRNPAVLTAYQHIGDRESYFRRVTKSLKPGGPVTIIDLTADSPEGPPKEFRFPPEKCISEMQQARFKLAVRYSFLPRQHFLVFQIASP